ncbi:MAG: sporulation initiation factor Spo0A C-terminal domain-containing protein [Oscillospiraceae bacterium]|nr:sporulation initiation factor Spo0A C-terminal domain-containing protein [Oscillospiraceae bacterium]
MESTIERTLCHILLLARHLDCCNFRGATVVALMELGVPTKSVGFEFLKKAIALQHKDPTRTLAKDIYMEISLHYKQNSEDWVEQAIRDAIKAAWRHGSRQEWDWYFSYDGRAALNKPTNSEFISRIAYVLEIWQECKIAKGDRYERE